MKTTAALAVCLAPLAPVLGHHSDAGIDMTSVVELEGTVTEYQWRNPHVYFNVTTTDVNGRETEWELQMPSTVTMTRMGWTRESLSPGEEITVWTHVAVDGRPYGILEFAEKADGTRLPTSFDYESGTVDPIGGQPEHGFDRGNVDRRSVQAQALSRRFRRLLPCSARLDREGCGGPGGL